LTSKWEPYKKEQPDNPSLEELIMFDIDEIIQKHLLPDRDQEGEIRTFECDEPEKLGSDIVNYILNSDKVYKWYIMWREEPK